MKKNILILILLCCCVKTVCAEIQLAEFLAQRPPFSYPSPIVLDNITCFYNDSNQIYMIDVSPIIKSDKYIESINKRIAQIMEYYQNGSYILDRCVSDGLIRTDQSLIKDRLAQGLPYTQKDKIKKNVKSCEEKFQHNCDLIDATCDKKYSPTKLREGLINKLKQRKNGMSRSDPEYITYQKKERQRSEQMHKCQEKYKECISQKDKLFRKPPIVQITKSLANFSNSLNASYRANGLVKPVTGRVISTDEKQLLFVDNGKIQENFPISDFGCTKVYKKEDQFYTLIGSEEHEENTPFTGIRTLNKKREGDVTVYTLQKYLNGRPRGTVYQEKHQDEVVYKPIIYLYPQEEKEIIVKVKYPEKLTHTYPKYTDKWHVLAEPTGSLTDIQTGRHLYALYWEGKDTTTKNTTDGFVVKGTDTISFFEKKLAQLGLNERETNEFIIYWLPKLENNFYNLIHFQSLGQQNKNMPLNITPKPDTLIRVLMEYKPLNEYIDIPEQILPPPPVRTGFTVVEWGGTELNKNED